MSTEYIIEAVMDAEFGGVDLVDEMYDRSFDILIEPSQQITLDIVNERYARAIQPLMDVETLGLSVTTSKDNAFGVDAEIVQYLGMSVDPKASVANSLNIDLEQLPQLSVEVSADRLGELPIDQDFSMELSPQADRAIESETEFGNLWGLDVLYLMRDILNIPPSGSITILDSINSPGAECPLDGAIIERGATTILQLDAKGLHLDRYLVEFFVYLDPQDTNSLLMYRCSDRRQGGGVRVESISPIVAGKQNRQLLSAQIPIEPDDFKGLTQTRTLFYRCVMSSEGMGEHYRIDKGKFTVSVE